MALMVAVLDQVGRPFNALWPVRHLEASWMTGLALARERGLKYGEEIVFPYGPWGMLDAPTRIDTDMVWIAGGFRALAVVMLFLAFLSCFSRNRAWRPWLAALLALLIGNCSTGGWMLALAVSLAGLALLAQALPPHPALLAAGAAASALLLQVKFSEGSISLAVVGLVSLNSRRPLVWLSTAAAFCAAFGVCWLAAQQPLENVWIWLSLSLEIVKGYPEAQAYLEMDSMTIVLMVGLVVTGAIVLLARGLSWVARLCALGIVLFMSKVALSLAEPGHLLLGYTGVFVVLVALAAGTKLNATRIVAIAMATVLGSGMLIPPTILARDLTGNILGLQDLPHEQAELESLAKRLLVEDLAIEPRLLDLLEDRPVITPMDPTTTWAHDLDWQPTPLFQRYVASTPRLDQLNAEAVMKDPDVRVLMEPDVGVLTLADWETPAYNLALLCNFTELGAGADWMVLTRVPDRCGTERRLMKERVKAGQIVSLPSPDESLVAVRFRPDPRSVADRVLAFLGPQRNLLHATVGDQSARVLEALAGGPLVVGAPVGESFLSSDPAPATISFDRAGELEIVEIPLSEAAEG